MDKEYLWTFGTSMNGPWTSYIPQPEQHEPEG